MGGITAAVFVRSLRVLVWRGEKVRSGKGGEPPTLLFPNNVILEKLLTYSSLSFLTS